jgi:hypothetical protein
VALEEGREPQRCPVPQGLGVADEHARRQDPGHHGGGGRAEPTAVRDPVDAGQVEPDLRRADIVERRTDGAHDEVVLAGRDLAAALPGDVDRHLRAAEGLDLDLVVDAEREAKGVEARAEVRAGRRDAHPDVVAAQSHGGLSPARARRRWT